MNKTPFPPRLRRQRPFNRPAPIDSGCQRGVREPVPFSPFDQRQGLALILDRPVRSPVSRLLFWCCPLAVQHPAERSALRTLRLPAPVTAVVVDAVDTVGRGRLGSHVGEEVRERIAPAGAHSDSPTSIVRISLALLVATSGANALPTPVLHSFSTLLRAPVCDKAAREASSYPQRAEYLSLKASAGAGAAFLQIVPVHDRGSAAVAHARPAVKMLVLHVEVRGDRQPTEAEAGQVLVSGLPSLRLGFSHHEALSQEGCVVVRRPGSATNTPGRRIVPNRPRSNQPGRW